jgi:hypothetical protein
VDVRHHGKVRVNEGQTRNILKLAPRTVFNRHAFHPGLDAPTGAGFDHFKFAHRFKLLSKKLLLTSPPRGPSGFGKTKKNPPGEIARRAA